MNRNKLILWDFNGTLLDDNELWYDSMSEVFKKHGKIPPTVSEYFHAMEGDWHKVYTSRGINASAEELNETYVPYYQGRMHETDLFPHVRITLVGLISRGFNMGLITGQPEELVKPLLKKFGIDGYFKPEFSSMHDRNKKETIQKILETSKILKENCFYVGDSPSDIKHGNHVGIKTVAFFNGFMPEDLVINKEPNYIIRNIAELSGIV